MSNEASGVANAVAEAIRASGRSKSDVAREVGIPPVTFRRKLAGRTPFRISELFLIAEATSVPPSRLLSPSPPA